jgi:hypothetical protein
MLPLVLKALTPDRKATFSSFKKAAMDLIAAFFWGGTLPYSKQLTLVSHKTLVTLALSL